MIIDRKIALSEGYHLALHIDPPRVLNCISHVHGGKEDCAPVPAEQWSSRLQRLALSIPPDALYWSLFTYTGISFHTNLMWKVHVSELQWSNVIFLIFLCSYLPPFTATIINFQFIRAVGMLFFKLLSLAGVLLLPGVRAVLLFCPVPFPWLHHLPLSCIACAAFWHYKPL